MGLKDELHLNKPLASVEHEALMNVYYGRSAQEACRGVFRPWGLTDVQFHLMMLLRHQGAGEGLSQARAQRADAGQPAQRNGTGGSAGATGAGAANGSRRPAVQHHQLTGKGDQLLDKADAAYGHEMRQVMGTEQKRTGRTDTGLRKAAAEPLRVTMDDGQITIAWVDSLYVNCTG